MSLISRLQSFFRKRQERQQEEIVRQVMPIMKLSGAAPDASKIDNDLLLKFFRNEEDERFPLRHEDIVYFTEHVASSKNNMTPYISIKNYILMPNRR